MASQWILRIGLGVAGGLLLAASSATAAGPYQFFTLPPCRVVDTRNPTGPLGGPSLAGGATRSFPVTGTCGIPSTAKAVVFNVAMVGPTGSGNLRIWPRRGAGDCQRGDCAADVESDGQHLGVSGDGGGHPRRPRPRRHRLLPVEERGSRVRAPSRVRSPRRSGTYGARLSLRRIGEEPDLRPHQHLRYPRDRDGCLRQHRRDPGGEERAPADLTGGRFASERGRDQLQRGPDAFERRDRSATSPWTPASAPACTWTSRCHWVLSVETRGRDTARVRFALLDEGRG